MGTFALWSWPEHSAPAEGGSVAAVAAPARSRSPPPLLPHRHTASSDDGALRSATAGHASAPEMIPGVQESWSTGVGACDVWLRDNIDDSQVLANFAEIPQRNRKSIVLKAMSTPKDNPVAWIAACIGHHRTREMEKRLLGAASPHQAPSAPLAGTPYASPASSAHSGSSARSVMSPLSDARPTLGRPASAHGSLGDDNWNQDPEMLAWAAETWKLNQKNNSALIRALRTTVSAETWALFSKVPPPVQAAIATTWVFACPCRGRRSDDILKNWIRRFNSVGTLSAQSASPAGKATNSSPTFPLQFIVIGCTAAFQFIVVEAAAKLTALAGRASFTLLPVLSCVVDGLTEAVLPHLQDAGSTVKIAACSSLQDMAERVATAANGWQRDGVKVVVLTTLPKFPSVPRNTARTGVLHAPDTRHFWFSQGLTGRLMGVLGQNNVVDIQVTPYNMEAEVRAELESLVGPATPCVEACQELSAAEKVWVFSNVKVSTTPVDNVRRNNHSGPIDGWVCAAGVTPTRSCGPVAAFAKLPALLCVRLFEERPLTEEESGLLDSMTMAHASAGEVRYPSRLFHHRWLGIEGTPLPGAIDKVAPCTPWLIPATGEPAEQGEEGGSVCGGQRYCLACEQIFSETAGLPPLAAVLPAVVGVLDVALQEWTQGGSEAWYTRKLDVVPHNCDAGCPKNPETGR